MSSRSVHWHQFSLSVLRRGILPPGCDLGGLKRQFFISGVLQLFLHIGLDYSMGSFNLKVWGIIHDSDETVQCCQVLNLPSTYLPLFVSFLENAVLCTIWTITRVSTLYQGIKHYRALTSHKYLIYNMLNTIHIKIHNCEPNFNTFTKNNLENRTKYATVHLTTKVTLQTLSYLPEQSIVSLPSASSHCKM